ncbi:MAG: UDP-galactopyranose mutase [Saccharofermentanales bacterium]
MSTNKKLDYLIVGSGLAGAVFAHEAISKGKTCLVVERRSHTGGNVYCEQVEGINVHKYGAHIFHTDNKRVWEYVNRFAEFNNYINSPISNYKGEIYNLPFNMNTFSRLWGISTPAEAAAIIAEQCSQITWEPANLEEQAIRLVGRDIFEKLIKGYTEKQWGIPCSELPASIIRRLPVRFTYDNNYFNDRYQGIPIGGYNIIIDKLLEGCEVMTGVDFKDRRVEFSDMADKIVYTGMVDEYFDGIYGNLEYRSLLFENEILDESNHQGVAVVNYTDAETPYTRIIEHKHFEFGTQPKTVITREYPARHESGMEAYYPINNDRNQALLLRYQELADRESNVLFCGRLAQYKYYDMDDVILATLELVDKEIK